MKKKCFLKKCHNQFLVIDVAVVFVKLAESSFYMFLLLITQCCQTSYVLGFFLSEFKVNLASAYFNHVDPL